MPYVSFSSESHIEGLFRISHTDLAGGNQTELEKTSPWQHNTTQAQCRRPKSVHFRIEPTAFVKRDLHLIVIESYRLLPVAEV